MATENYSQHTTIDLPTARLDLPTWLFGMTDDDYQATAVAHRALGTWERDGVRGMVNEEAIGGNLLIQHYTEQPSAPDHVVMWSPRTELYLMKMFRVRIGVRWVMTVVPDGPNTSTFTCQVQTVMPGWLHILGMLSGSTRAIRAHVNEETGGYARDIAASTARREQARQEAAA